MTRHPRVPVFGEVSRCPKCGGYDHTIQWHPAGDTVMYGDQLGEHMGVTCLRCGYTEPRTPLDAA